MIRVILPGSTSNIGPGFDTLGLAVDRYLSLQAQPQRVTDITLKGYGSSSLPRDASNLVVRSMNEVLRRYGKDPSGCSLLIDNGIPDCGGLGVSGAMIAGGVVLANELGSLGLPIETILGLATEIEGHPDNVTAALLGGLTVSSFDSGALRTRSIPVPGAVKLVVALPEFRIVTKEARSALPKTVAYGDAVSNVQNAATLVASLAAGDFQALRWATVDRLHEHVRAGLIPGFDDVKRSALEAGALAVSISGSGPSVVAFALGHGDEIGKAMTAAFARHGIGAGFAELHIENSGVRIER